MELLCYRYQNNSVHGGNAAAVAAAALLDETYHSKSQSSQCALVEWERGYILFLEYPVVPILGH